MLYVSIVEVVHVEGFNCVQVIPKRARHDFTLEEKLIQKETQGKQQTTLAALLENRSTEFVLS